jgi:CelD/BcsL family acetyltransferase involved in cellulose biosynthesis
MSVQARAVVWAGVGGRETFEWLSGIDGDNSEWSRLARASGNLFATPEWQAAWWKHYGGDRPLLAGVARDENDEAVAIVSMYLVSQRPLRLVKFVGHGPGGVLGPICAPASREQAAAALRRALEQTPVKWDAFVGEDMAGDEGWPGLTGAPVIRRTESPVVEVPSGGWDTYMATRSRNFRKKLGVAERKLAQDHAASFRLVDGREGLDDALDTLFELYRSRWGTGSPVERFHRDFAGIAADRGWLRLRLLELDGRPAGVSFAFRFESTEWLVLAARDPALTEESPGFVLRAHVIRDALDTGATRCRLLRGGQAYKQRFATSDPGLDTIAIARTPLGWAARTGLRASRSLPFGLRQRLARAGGYEGE